MDAFDARVEAVGCHDLPIGQWPADLRREIEESWEGIFELHTWSDSAPVQATLHEICTEDVVRAVRVR